MSTDLKTALATLARGQQTAWPQHGDPVLYDNPHTGEEETGWLYDGPHWHAGRIRLRRAGDLRITAEAVDPARIQPVPA